MVEFEAINIKTTKAGPYSHAIKVGNLIFVSGQISDLSIKTIKDQTINVFNKIKRILEAGGSKFSKIIKVTIFLKDIKEFGIMNQTYEEFFKNNGINETFPARTTVEISNLPKPNLKIEIDVIATI
ncbi:MAG: RidA family protein [Candidatus Lokiarchaeota archaeon]|nr:RidA family protein [Candidatus Lokiarchaeota archaeon]